MPREITIRDVLPPKKETDDELKWIFESLGLSSGRDLEETSFKIMQELLDQSKTTPLISSEEIAKALSFEQPRVNHHFRNFVDSGIVIREKRKITLRGGSLTSALEEMKKDTERMFEKLIEASKRRDLF